MDKKSQRLVRAAIEARERAYCPYSRFAVGSAVEGGSGRIYTGCNVENASYGLTICAERVAIFKAAAAGERKILAIAIVLSGKEPGSPCGACRQVIYEFGPKAKIVMANLKGRTKIQTITQILPLAFGPENLK